MRDDILVSVGVADEYGPRVTIPHLIELVRVLEDAFAFHEVLYVVPERRQGELAEMSESIANLPNLRVVLVSETTRYYRRRLIAAREAIGDVVALYDPNEMNPADLPALLTQAWDRNEIIAGRMPPRAGLGLTYRVLSFGSRYRVTERAARSIIFPREWLGNLLARRSAVIDLRFEARLPIVPYRPFDLARRATRNGQQSHRYELLVEIIQSDASRYLKGYALAGMIVAGGALVYILYAVAILLMRSHVQEGWFSNAVTLGGSTAFIALGMSLLAIAFVALLDAQQSADDRSVVGEISHVNYFKNARESNVEGD